MSLLSRLAAAVAGALPQPRTDAQPATPAAAGPVSRLDGLISFLSGIGTNQDKGRAGRWMLSRRRAELIARDQVGKLNGQLTMLRQSAYGVEAYIWRTSLDERVRQMHADREGERFEWSTPPEDGHPGMPIQCCCVAEPDIQEQLDELERLGEAELEYGQPDEELLRTGIDELAQWQPNVGLIRRLKEEANAGLALTLPRGGAVGGPVPRPVRPVRQPVRTARTAQGSTPKTEQATEEEVKRAQAEETRRQQEKRDETKAKKTKEQEDARAANLAAKRFKLSRRTRQKGPLPDKDTTAVVRPDALRGASPGVQPPQIPPMHDRPPTQVVISRGQSNLGDLDAVTADGFEEFKRGAGLASLSGQKLADWMEKVMVQMDNTILAIEDFKDETDTLLEAETYRVTLTSAQLAATPKQYTLLLETCPDSVLQAINVAFDKVRAYNPSWTILVRCRQP